MSYGIDSGEQRVAKAFHKALHSPLLNDNDIYKAKKILFNIYYNPNSPMKVVELEEVDTFMKQFTDENIEVIWGVSKDFSLANGDVKVTVLATGFGMKNIPGMEPVVREEEETKAALTREELARKEREEQQLNEMQKAFYKHEYRTYIFSDKDIDDENLIAMLDNSPTYKRSAREFEYLKSMANGSESAQECCDNEKNATIDNNSEKIEE